MGIGKLESFLENHIEGFFNKRFSSSLELVELIKGIERSGAAGAWQGHASSAELLCIHFSWR